MKMMLKRFYNTPFLFFLLVIACNDDPDVITGEEEMMPEVAVEDLLPQFLINTNGATIVDEPKIDAELVIVEAGVETHRGAIGIEIRGSSSQQFPKKSFGFETRDEANEDLDVSLLGFPEEEDWILYAPYSDKSLMRNHLIYELSNDMGRYASRSKLAEVYINGVYNGMYVFMEKLKRDSNRIDINKLKDDENTGEDLTGGYILKLDKADGTNETLYTDTNSFPSQIDPPNSTIGQEIHFLYDDPDDEDITPEQKEYISTYVNGFETALASDTFTDPDVGYRAFIDTDSFIDFFLLNELSNNVDGYRLSTWITKDKNEKLKMGPIWDFNLAFGNADYCSGGSNMVWAYRFNERCSNDTWQIPFWWERLLEDPAFVTQLQERWTTLRASTFSEGYITEKIDDYVTEVQTSGSAQANFSRWPVLGVYVWPNNFVGSSYDSEVTYLKDWITQRLNWLDTEIESL
ncbi:CotH kinase family protein [Dokdonia pacifica]|uniref:CotH protein n=1 Tax=Dokdonia pacifica TaxID=1627892 RepID=A0A238YGG2_9FLAO|nr:CotH kinase family protein [Dokdonia pacifica]SNR69703.1 CotH protein [Dokdonia pacifica]